MQLQCLCLCLLFLGMLVLRSGNRGGCCSIRLVGGLCVRGRDRGGRRGRGRGGGSLLLFSLSVIQFMYSVYIYTSMYTYVWRKG